MLNNAPITEESRLCLLEKGMIDLNDEIKNLKLAMHESEKEKVSTDKEMIEMRNDIKDVKIILRNMSKQKSRYLGVALIIIGLIISSGATYAAFQNNRLTQVLISITKQTNVP